MARGGSRSAGLRSYWAARWAGLLIADAFLLHLSMMSALALRFVEIAERHYYGEFYRQQMWIYIPAALVFLAAIGLYTCLCRYAGRKEIAGTAVALALANGLFAILVSSTGFPRSVILMQWLLATLFIAGLRLGLGRARLRGGMGSAVDQAGRRAKRLLVVGAGQAGAMLLEDLHRYGRVVGFLDDDPQKYHMQVRGVRVLGSIVDAPQVVADQGIDEVIMAIPSLRAARRSEILEALSALPVKIKTVPGTSELLNGRVSVSHIRSVPIEDLLSRDPVEVDLNQIAGYLTGERVLVTGAGGSIGSELCRRICHFKPALLVLLGHGENSIFEAAMDLENSFPDIPKLQVIADVRDREEIDRIFAELRPTVVFHAAAHKHVPYMEEFPDEAVKTNVFGTQNVALSALNCRTRKFVMISTDKAVNPSSVMGATKRVAEMVVQDLNGRGGTKFVSVRFGNVLGSRGSVIPVFQRQIAQGGPVTVTDPEMRRYFMTIPEAAQLVLQAAVLGRGGEVFLLDMGEPVRIADLACDLITLSGFRPHKDIRIVFTGRRPGEKLFEELLLDDEATCVTEHTQIFISKNSTLPADELARRLAFLEDLTFGGHVAELVPTLQRIVRGYVPYVTPVEEAAAALAEE